jgi:hypothetical protein
MNLSHWLLTFAVRDGEAQTSMFFEVSAPTYHSPITIIALT